MKPVSFPCEQSARSAHNAHSGSVMTQIMIHFRHNCRESRAMVFEIELTRTVALWGSSFHPSAKNPLQILMEW